MERGKIDLTKCCELVELDFRYRMARAETEVLFSAVIRYHLEDLARNLVVPIEYLDRAPTPGEGIEEI